MSSTRVEPTSDCLSPLSNSEFRIQPTATGLTGTRGHSRTIFLVSIAEVYRSPASHEDAADSGLNYHASSSFIPSSHRDNCIF